MPEPGSRWSAPARHAPLILAAALLLGFGIFAQVQGDTASSSLLFAVFAACAPPAVVEYLAKVRIPASLLLQYALLLIAAPFLGSYQRLYDIWPVWDTIVHFGSGFPITLGMVFVLGVTAHRSTLVMPPWLEGILLFSVGMTVAALWETSEFLSDIVIGTQAQKSNLDTMLDLVAGGLAAAMVAVAFVLYRHRGWFGGFSRLLSG